MARHKNMKTVIQLSLLILIPFVSMGQFYYEIGDTLMITAKSGLKLRDSTSIHSKNISVIPFGGKVISKSLPIKRDEIENKFGTWIEVSYNDNTGFVFSGFVTKAKFPKYNKQKHCTYVFDQSWWVEFAKMNADSLKCSGSKRYPGFDPDKGGRISQWELFSNETIIYFDYQYELTDLIVETNEINMNDLLNLLEYYIVQSESCLYSGFNSKYNDIKIDLKKVNFGKHKRIERIDCEELGFHAEKSINKTIFRINLVE